MTRVDGHAAAWPKVPLEEIVLCFPGHWGADAPAEGSVPAQVLGVGNVLNDGGLDVTSVPVRYLAQSEIECLAQEGDLLVVKSSGSATNIRSGKTAICPHRLAGKIACSNFMLLLRPRRDQVEPRWLWWYLNSQDAKAFVRLIAGSSTYPNIKWSSYRNLSIPIPDLPTQRGILAKLDEQMTTLASAQAALATQREAATALRSAVLRAALDPATHPDWQYANLGDICSFEYGTSLPEHDRRAGPFPVVGSSGVVGSHREALIHGPTIVVGRKGSVGKITWVDGDCWPIDTTYFVRVRQSAEVSERFLCLFLEFLDLASLNQQGAVPGLNRDDAYRLPIALPSLQRQESVTAHVDEAADRIAVLIAALDAQALTLDSLRTSLLDAAFGGKV